MVTKPRTRLTVRDYLAIPEDDENRYELIDGELYMAPAPTWGHQRNKGKLYSTLERFVYANGLGEVIDAPLDVYLSDEDVFQPDIAFISNERMDIIHSDGASWRARLGDRGAVAKHGAARPHFEARAIRDVRCAGVLAG